MTTNINISSTLDSEEIPEQYRDFEEVGIKGKWLDVYWKFYNNLSNEELSICHMKDYLSNYFPSWTKVAAHLEQGLRGNTVVWTETDHNDLRQLCEFYETHDANCDIIFSC